LLRAHSVSVLLPHYRRTLVEKYSARNVLLGTHGTFAATPTPPDFTKRGNPDLRILAIGHWGTYKRLETLMEAFPAVLEKVPNARLVVAGANHHTKPGYWESIREAQPKHLPIDFLGYVAEEAIPELFGTTSILVLPYDSATGSSGPAHQACEYGVPIVCADISDLREMVADEDMAVSFFTKGDAGHLAKELTTILQSQELQRSMAEHNFAAGVQMTMGSVVQSYLRWFELKKYQKDIAYQESFPWSDLIRALFSKSGKRSSSESFAGTGDGMDYRHRTEPKGNRALSAEFANPLTWRKSETLGDSPDTDRYSASHTLESEL
jgi:glycosyltransferase involved in cell wall biosynthesis